MPAFPPSLSLTAVWSRARRDLRRTLGLLLLVPALAGAAPDTLRVAVNLSNTPSVTYFFSPYAEALVDGLQEELPGTKVVIDLANNKYDKALAKKLFDEQVARGFDLFVSGSGSTSAILAADVTALGKPHLMIAFEPGIVRAGPDRFRVLPSYASEAAIFLQAATDRGATRVAALRVETPGITEQYDHWLAPGFAHRGIAFAAESFAWNGTDYRAALKRLMATEPDLLLISAYHQPHLLPLIAALREEVPAHVPVVLTMHAVDLLHDGTDPRMLADYYFVSPVFETTEAGPAARAWASRWQARHDHKAPFYSAAYGFDAGRLLGRAIKASAPMAEAIRKVGPFDGLVGRVELDADGDLKGTLALCRLNAASVPEPAAMSRRLDPTPPPAPR